MLSFTDNNGIRYFDREWLRKPPTFSGRNKGMLTKVKRDLR